MLRLSPVGAVFVCLGLISCDTARPLLEPTAASRQILDGRDAGSAFAGSGVFLLPPISDNDFVRTGPFDPDTDPRVEICRLDIAGTLTEDGIEAAECAETVAWFETDAASDGLTFVTVTPAAGEVVTDSMYSVGWNTSTADADKAFRVTILLPDLSLVGGLPVVTYSPAARFDAVLYSNASTKLDAERIVGYNAGQNFPVKFIVEEGSGCNGLDCFAYRVTCEAAVYQTEHAGVRMPEDWASECDTGVPGPERNWWLFQERLPEGSPCVPGNLVDGIHFEPCYVWQLVEEIDTGNATTFEPYVAEFAQEVLVQWCNNAEADGGVPEAWEDLVSGYRFSNPPGEAVALEESSEPALTTYTCPYDGEGSIQGGLAALSWLEQRVVSPALRILGLEPRPLFAGDRNTLTDRTVRMSDFQKILPLTVDAGAGALPGQIITGSTATATVRVVAPPHHEPLDGPGAGIPDLAVQFQVVSGDATLSAPGAVPCPDGSGGVIAGCIQVTTSLNDLATTTDEGGFASVQVTAGATAGSVEIEVRVPADPDMAPVVLSFEVVELAVIFGEPLEKPGEAWHTVDEAFVPTVHICANATVGCTAATAAAVIPSSEIKLVTDKTGRKQYQASFKPTTHGVPVGGPYYAQVLVGSATVGFSIPIHVTTGGRSERSYDPDRYDMGEKSNLDIKFSIFRP